VKQIIIDSEAEIELSESVDYYERKVTGLGLEFERAVGKAIEVIRSDPARSPVQKSGTRRFVMKRFPFVIHYLELTETIWILAFAHTSRRPGYWRRRL